MLYHGNNSIIEPDEAEIVKRIYREFLEGKTPREIMKGLNREGYRTKTGKGFCLTSVKRILRNEIYKGDLILQKYYVADPIRKVQKVNRGELPRYHIRGDHEAIIEPEVFEAVQMEIGKRFREWEENEYDFDGMRALSHLIKCGRSGATMHHSPYRTGFGGDGSWGCHKKECPYEEECIVKSIPDLAVRQACTRALGMEEFDGERVREEISRIVSPKDGWLVVCLKNGQTYTDCFRSVLDPVEKQGKKGNCFTNRIRCGFCGHYYNAHSFYDSRKTRLVQWNCHHCRNNTYINENVLKFRIKDALGWEDFSFERCRNEIQVIEMDRPCHLVIRLYDGEEKEAEYYAVDRRVKEDGEKRNEDTGDGQPVHGSSD